MPPIPMDYGWIITNEKPAIIRG